MSIYIYFGLENYLEKCLNMYYLKSLEKLMKFKLGLFWLQKYRTKFNANVKIIIKAIFMLLSLCGFIYQVQIIYDQYMKGKTFVSFKIGQLSEDSISSVTICYRDLFSMERASVYIPYFTQE